MEAGCRGEKGGKGQGVRMETESHILIRAEHGEVELGKWVSGVSAIQAG